MTHIIVAGGISVNDKEGHDKYPYNFLDPAGRRVSALKNSGVAASDIIVAMYTPAYEVRVTEQDEEHSSVTPTYAPCPSPDFLWLCALGVTKKKNPQHFYNVAHGSVTGKGATLKTLRKASDLTDLLKNTTNIESLYYFGHSNAKLLFLEYSVDGRGTGTVTWGKSEAAAVPASNFRAGAVFATFGCNQGDPGGLAEQLQALWGIRTIGSLGKTNYETIGQGLPFPSSNGGYVKFDGAGATPVTTSDF